MTVHIDPYAGFCFGVRRAIEAAEKAASEGSTVFSLGEIVHNDDEVRRLKGKGIQAIATDQYLAMENCHVVIRAHGEPRQTYRHAQDHDITLVDATCPVVKKLQRRVSDAVEEMKENNGLVILFGKPDHPEVKGLVGQAEGPLKVVTSKQDLDELDLPGPVRVFSQTTMDEDQYEEILKSLEERTNGEVIGYRTICRQVSGRADKIRDFAVGHDVVIFVSSPRSSNGQYLFSLCREMNERSFMISSAGESRSR